MGRFTSLIVALSAAGLIAGCAEPRPQAAASSPVETVAYKPPPSSSLGPLPDAGSAPPAAGPTLAELAKDPSHFEGLAARDVKAALGDPNFLRRENPAEVWQYYGPGCILDLFLYDDQGSRRVAHAELRGRGEGQRADIACLSRLIDARRGLRAG